MRPGDDSQDAAPELRITDKRRFTSTGDIREDAPPVEAGAAEPPAAVETAPAPPLAPPREEARAGADPRGNEPRGGAHDAVFDLGVEAVFYVFYQSALIALGATQPGGPPARVDLAEARQAISFLKVLEDKTRGNLDADEAATLRELLTEAQMAFVQVARSAPGGGA